jgi:hypothetical protein
VKAQYSVSSVHPVGTYEDSDARSAIETVSAKRTEPYGDNPLHRWERQFMFDPETYRMVEMMILHTSVEIEKEEDQ